MKTILKYEIKAGCTLEIETNGGESRPLKVQNINGRIYMWFLHDKSNLGKIVKRYKSFATGYLIEEQIMYIDTFFIDDLVFHVCEVY